MLISQIGATYKISGPPRPRHIITNQGATSRRSKKCLIKSLMVNNIKIVHNTLILFYSAAIALYDFPLNYTSIYNIKCVFPIFGACYNEVLM